MAYYRGKRWKKGALKTYGKHQGKTIYTNRKGHMWTQDKGKRHYLWR